MIQNRYFLDFTGKKWLLLIYLRNFQGIFLVLCKICNYAGSTLFPITDWLTQSEFQKKRFVESFALKTWGNLDFRSGEENEPAKQENGQKR